MSLIPRVNRVELGTLEPQDWALELMFFGLRGMTREADEYLAGLGLSRVHHRILFILARRETVVVGELVATLGVSKQAMHRPMRQLLEAGLVRIDRDPARRRFKVVALTGQGQEVERRASELERRVMQAAFDNAGEGSVEGWERVMREVAKSA